ncbi:hypothetical protein B0T14DRAFT_498640 [Immersiella caudata]|uniref:Uncharacterized protein n=1 Tax=Immersiella caudata TaxID=314043 RepID=A0AA40BXX1_9PEZI|nr:hypothetical protein B0T14DRAFT_498640 [Immersiella caudata]
MYLTEPILHGDDAATAATAANATGQCGPGCAMVHVVKPTTTAPTAENAESAGPNSSFYYECKHHAGARARARRYRIVGVMLVILLWAVVILVQLSGVGRE